VVERHRRRLGRRVRRVTIDLDPTEDPTHGGQQLSLFNGHYNTWCYLPVAGFLTFNDEPESYLFATPVLVDDYRTVDFFGLKHDSTWQISDSRVLKVGADVRWLGARYRYSVADLSSSTAIRLDPRGSSVGIYAAYRTRVTSTLATELGVR